jgi:hypothetical protein
MPEPTAPGTVTAGTTTGTSTGTVQDTGKSSGAEPRIGWAGDESKSIQTEQHTDEGTELEAGDGEEFGDESFEDEGLEVEESQQKQEIPFKDLLEQSKSQDPKIQKAAEKALKRDYFENRRYKQIPGFENPRRPAHSLKKWNRWAELKELSAKPRKRRSFGVNWGAETRKFLILSKKIMPKGWPSSLRT